MLRVVELKETLEDSQLIDNIYAINKITQDMVRLTEFMIDFNYNDYRYINVVMERCKRALEKVYSVMEI